MRRKIAAILAADIVGYSRLVNAAEEETVGRLAHFRQAFDELVTAFGGRIVNTVGDAVLAEFQSSVEAVRCAVNLQERAAAESVSCAPGRAMVMRIGINAGDIVENDRGELFGDAVNIAARLEHLAPPGTICISRAVHEQVANKVAVTFQNIGPQQLKNIADPVEAFVIDPSARADADKKRIGFFRRYGPRWRFAAGVAAAGVLAVAVLWIGERLVGHPGPEGTAAKAAPPPGTASLAGIPVAPLNEMRLRQVAAAQDIQLPDNLKILTPAPSVAPAVAKYLGAWGSDDRWNGGGRRAILVVESVDTSGTALGFYAHGPAPNAIMPKRAAGRFTSFVGTISDEGLRFAWGQAKYRFTVAPDDSMWGLWQTAGPQGSFNLTITLNRVR